MSMLKRNFKIPTNPTMNQFRIVYTMDNGYTANVKIDWPDWFSTEEVVKAIVDLGPKLLDHKTVFGPDSNPAVSVHAEMKPNPEAWHQIYPAPSTSVVSDA